MKKFITLLFALCCYTFSHSQLVISQVYGGGGNAGAIYTHDFVEIFNAGTTSVDLDGYSVQYASAGGTSWATKTNLPAVTLAPGQYFLLQGAAGSGNGVALPTPDFVGGINLSGTNGKVALVNSTTALTGACPTDASIVDMVGFGSASCFESAATPVLSNSTAAIRNGNGCTDTNNNSGDFTVGTPFARNMASPLNSCGAPSSTLSASPGVLTLSSTTGVASTSASYNLSGSLLTGSAIVVTAGSNLEVSLNNTTFTPSVNVTYTGTTLDPTTIYVRSIASAPQGILSSTVTNVGGGASLTVNVSGSISQHYYSKGGGALNLLSTWGTNPDGSGATPADFSTPYQVFNITNQLNPSIDDVWDISGEGSKAVVGSGVDFLIPELYEVTSTSRIDVSQFATLTIQNTIRPFLGALETNSTVDFAQPGNGPQDTVRIPALNYYNLRLSGGLKYLSGGTTTVRGVFEAVNVLSFNGGTGPFSTLNAQGDMFFLNTTFDASPSGDLGRITLALNSVTGNQNLLGFGTMHLFRIRRDSVNYSVNIFLDNSLSLVLGNATSGGLQLTQGASTTTTLTTGSSTIELAGGAFISNGSMGAIAANNTSFTINKSVGASSPGTLKFAPGSTINNFYVSLGSAVTADSITIDETVTIVGELGLFSGKLVVTPGKWLDLQGVYYGGSTTSFIDGRVTTTVNSGSFLPMGKGNKYAPLYFNNVSTSFTPMIQYHMPGVGDTDIDPATLAQYPDYRVSTSEYWTISSTDNVTADITFYYNDAEIANPSQLRVAGYDGTDWSNLGGTPGGLNTTSEGFVEVTGITAFDRFTFAAETAGVLPVTLLSFQVQKANNTAKITWTTSQEINSSHFVIERSLDGRTWNEIANVQAAGNSNTQRNYYATDINPAKGINYYRLRMIDLDARAEISDTRTLSMTGNSSIVISPNPAVDFVRINLFETEGINTMISIHDQHGKMISVRKATGQVTGINVSDLASGVYYIKIQNGEVSTTHKLIKK